MPTSKILAKVKSSGVVTAEDALAARRIVYGDDGGISPDEIEMLFRIDEAAKTADPSWSALVVEAGVDFIVHQEMPQGYISETNADWLIQRISADDMVKTATELELAVKVLEAAQASPERLVAFALHQVEVAVVEGKGPLASGHDLQPGRVSRTEAALVRRILYAFGGHAGVSITRAEAEVLFNINDASAEADNDPEWTDLFVKAIANCIMAASGYQAPAREVALAQEKWLDSPSPGVGGFLARMAAGGLSGVLDAYTAPAGVDWQARHALVQGGMRVAEAVSEDEAGWLADRIGRDGTMHENERALLRFIGEESHQVHPSLRDLIEKAA
ncbi:MAG: hypothetical protein WD036_00705 [Bauldia sp.]